ncbi:MAG TPA: lysylphosphatidylglycerol synthase transmembrane domain-containing protein [Miltoncostaeaceae bacterium]|nr:lysylphosphatidylglycerol synthase transmembrane domain-containing protein [Miltoncostaeaceae bacterium]
MDSIRSFFDAVQAFGERLAAVHWGFLAGAIAFSVANLALRSRAWQQILRAALPAERIRYRTAFGAYCVGVGVNAAIPARVGDVVKLFLVKRSTRDAHYPTLVGTLVAETLFDFVVASALLVWALQAGVLPGVRLPDIPAFDLSWAFRNGWIVLGVVVALAVVTFFAARRVRAFWRQFGQGLAIVRTPGRYLGSVASWQAVGWVCRVAGAWFFLEAFNVPGSLENALIVQVAGSLGSLFPATPGGLGPTQALLVVMLAGEAGRTGILAFSAGMELTLLIVNVTLAVVCGALILRNLRFRKAIADARADRAGEAAPPG